MYFSTYIPVSDKIIPKPPALRRYPLDCFKEPDYMFGLITMIGGYLDADMQYIEVSEKLRKYRYEKLPKKKLFLPVLE